LIVCGIFVRELLDCLSRFITCLDKTKLRVHIVMITDGVKSGIQPKAIG